MSSKLEQATLIHLITEWMQRMNVIETQIKEATGEPWLEKWATNNSLVWIYMTPRPFLVVRPKLIMTNDS